MFAAYSTQSPNKAAEKLKLNFKMLVMRCVYIMGMLRMRRASPVVTHTPGFDQLDVRRVVTRLYNLNRTQFRRPRLLDQRRSEKVQEQSPSSRMQRKEVRMASIANISRRRLCTIAICEIHRMANHTIIVLRPSFSLQFVALKLDY